MKRPRPTTVAETATLSLTEADRLGAIKQLGDAILSAISGDETSEETMCEFMEAMFLLMLTDPRPACRKEARVIGQTVFQHGMSVSDETRNLEDLAVSAITADEAADRLGRLLHHLTCKHRCGLLTMGPLIAAERLLGSGWIARLDPDTRARLNALKYRRESVEVRRSEKHLMARALERDARWVAAIAAGDADVARQELLGSDRAATRVLVERLNAPAEPANELSLTPSRDPVPVVEFQSLSPGR